MASSGASAAAAANGAGGSSSYTGKAHELIPEFSGKANDYKEYRKRVLLYERKMDLAGRKTETAFNVMSSLKNRAWDACEDLTMEVLESERGVKEILTRLDAVFKYDAITELPQDFENFFIQMQRKRNETMQEYTANFERQLRRLAAHEVQLPKKVIGWYYLRRAGLSQQQRQLIMSTITTSTLSLDSVRKAVNFVVGQDQTPEGASGSRDHRFNKMKDSIYTVSEDAWSYDPEPGDAYYEDEESWEIGPDDSMSQAPWIDDEPIHHEADDDILIHHEADDDILLAMDAASEYDDIMANYVEARSKLNQLRVSRGYYPVVAIIPDQKGYVGGAGKGKGKKGKSKGKSKQMPRPSAKARGKAALGAIKCLRCGRAGHMAANCPAAQNKRKAETDPENEIHMVMDSNIEEVNIFDEDGTESEPDDTAMFDCGAASVIIGMQQLRRLMKALLMKGCDIAAIPARKCEKGLRFGNGNRDVTTLCVLVPTFFKNKRRDILMYVMEGSTPCLLGRPALESFNITINYGAKIIAYDDDLKFEPATLGQKGEFIVHLVEDYHLVKEKKVADQVFVPEDFDNHIFEQVPLHSVLQVPADAFMETEVSIIAENSAPETTPDITEMETSPAQKTGEQRDVLDDEELDKLHPGQLNKLYYETVSAMKELDMDIYRAKDLENFMPPRTYTIWRSMLVKEKSQKRPTVG